MGRRQKWKDSAASSPIQDFYDRLLQKETAAFLARDLFEILAALAGQPRNIRVAGNEGQTQGGRRLLDKTGILAGLLAAQLMVQVDHAEMEVPAGGELEQHVQQAS